MSSSAIQTFPYGYNKNSVPFTFNPIIGDTSQTPMDVSPQPIGNYSGRITVTVNDQKNSSTTSFDVDGGYGNLQTNTKKFYLIDNSFSSGVNLSSVYAKPNIVSYQDSNTNLYYNFRFSPNPAFPHTVQRANTTGALTGLTTVTVSNIRLAH